MQPPSDEPQIGGEEPRIGEPEEAAPRRASPTPSAYLYRGALVALAVASLIAVYLVLRPPENDSVQQVVRDVATSTPASAETATATPEGQTATPTATNIPPSPTPTGPTDTPTPKAGSTVEYVVKSGEFLSTIAADLGTTVEAILELNPDINPDTISVGQVILVPAP